VWMVWMMRRYALALLAVASPEFRLIILTR
jgi:hypothetical protein